MPLIIVVMLVSGLLSWPLGRLLSAALEPGEQPGRWRRRLEGWFVRIGGRPVAEEQGWKRYALSMLTFNAASFALCFLILAGQHLLPLNPDHRRALDPSLVFHTAVSFVTNTNLQHYSGEVSLSYFSQLFALMWLQFVSAATGLAVLAALSRGLAGRVQFGNFYRDLLRVLSLVLLPLSLLVASLLVLAGVPMTLRGAVSVRTLEGAAQTIARGPVAAFEAIKQLGSNGGGFFGANSAHPFENPTFFSNLVECVAILALPMACVWMFGRLTRRMRHAAVVFAVMGVLLLAMVAAACQIESRPTPALRGLAVAGDAVNLEGKELRFGTVAGPVWAAATTAVANGSVNCSHASLNPLTGLVALFGMWLNLVFGGKGVGMVNMFIYIIVGVFLCGMMVGRTPEYLTRRVETREMKLALLALLIHPLLIMGGTALFTATSWGSRTVLGSGSHGFSEIVYEFSSAAANNGSGFEGLGDHTIAWNLATGLVMLVARYLPIVLPLAIAGSLASKKPAPETSGTLRTDTPLFGAVLLGMALLVGALLFLPLAVLGPVAEHLAAAGT